MDGYPQIPIPQDAPGPRRCIVCGGTAFTPGFLDDQAAQGYTKWIVGELEKGIFGGAARMGRPRLDIIGQRCDACGHLELFAN
ncbi:MAG: hypothetical protein V9G19_05530 [Tetrasphaera sp.]